MRISLGLGAGLPGALSHGRVGAIAATAVLVLACGKIPAATDGDGGPIGGIDAAPATGTMQVRVFGQDGLPLAEATVVHTRPDGTRVTALATGPNGTASFEVTGGDIVHVGLLATQNQASRLYTFVGVQPGDDIPVDEPSPSGPDPTDLGSLTVTMPGLPGVANYTVDLGCTRQSAGMPSVTLSVPSDCVGSGGRLFVIAYAQNSAGEVVQGAILGLVTPPEPGTTIAENVDAWEPAVSRQLTLVGLPDTVETTREGQFETFLGQRRYETREGSSKGMSESQMFRFSTVKPSAAYPGEVELTGTFGFITGPGPAGQEQIDGLIARVVRNRGLGSEAQLEVDFSRRPPRFFEASVSASERRFAWKTESTDEQLDFQADSDFMLLFANFGEAGRWVVLAPPATTAPIAFDLHELSGFVPDGGDTLPAVVLLLESPALGGYDVVRSTLGADALERLFDGLDEYEATASFSGAGLN